MKKHGILLSFGALTCALFLSGCMAAMMPAMLLGHAAHHKSGASHDQCPKSCDCEKPAAKTDAQGTPAAQTDEKPASPPSSQHKH
ncbi:MAG: hypothetical protein HY736_21870 [Verrucomicrobia bacterium]|nr:hypothetical protein [Verrucomicrobiota bacterium]